MVKDRAEARADVKRGKREFLAGNFRTISMLWLIPRTEIMGKVGGKLRAIAKAIGLQF